MSYNYRPAKSIVSRNQCCGILLGLVIWVIVLLPIILSWTALSVASPQRPLVWTTANYNRSTQSVAIKVNNCNKIPFSIDSLSIEWKIYTTFFFNLVNCFERKLCEANFWKPSFCWFQSKIFRFNTINITWGFFSRSDHCFDLFLGYASTLNSCHQLCTIYFWIIWGAAKSQLKFNFTRQYFAHEFTLVYWLILL